MQDTFNIIGIDPGNNLGVSIFTIDSINYNICNIETRTYVLNRLIEEENSLNRLLVLSDIVNNLYMEFDPLAIGLEDAFMNFRFPKAIINLAKYVGLIELEFIKLNRYIKVFKYAPKYIKSIISTGDANKSDMLCGVSNIPELAKFLNVNTLTEHSIDATAIGYVTLLDIRNNTWILLTI